MTKCYHGINKSINYVKKLSRTNGILSKLRHFIPVDVAISVYYSLFYSYLLYGCLVWSYTNQGNINRLTKLQKKCIRILTFSNFNSHTGPLFYELKLLKFEDIVINQKILFMYDTFQDHIPDQLKKLFTFNKTIHSYETRSQLLFHISEAKTTKFGINTLRYDGPRTWNQFYNEHLNTTNVPSQPSLKKVLKDHFINSYK